MFSIITVFFNYFTIVKLSKKLCFNSHYLSVTTLNKSRFSVMCQTHINVVLAGYIEKTDSNYIGLSTECEKKL